MEADLEFLKNHREKCRFCFSLLASPENSTKLSKSIESQFFELTQLRLRTSVKKYSQKTCHTCSDELEKFSKFRKDLLWKQKKLHDFVDQKVAGEDGNFTPKVEIKKEKEEVEVQPETCVIIKTEQFEHFEVPEHIKEETNESDSSNGSFEDFFQDEKEPSTTTRKKSKSRKPHQKKDRKPNVKKSSVWRHCPHCDRKFFTDITLQVHIDTVHFKFKNFPCEKCDFKTHKPHLLKGHIARVHDRTKILPSTANSPRTSCPICGLMVQRVSSHIRNVHTKPKNVFCDICGFGIFNLNRLRRHMFKHLSKETKHELISYKCDLCGASLHSKNSVRSHIKNVHMQTGERKFVCFCGKSYKAESYLKVHQKGHEKTATLPCLECGKKFMNKSMLKIHMEIHERKGRKDFACEICGGRYGSMALLIRHKIFHTEPQHACEYCGKKFHRRCFVERHVKTQHEIEETPCQFCGKMLNSYSMRRHVKEFHSGLEKLNCPIPGCNGTYLRRSHLKDHMQRTHKDYLNMLTVDERNSLEETINQMNLI